MLFRHWKRKRMHVMYFFPFIHRHVHVCCLGRYLSVEHLLPPPQCWIYERMNKEADEWSNELARVRVLCVTMHTVNSNYSLVRTCKRWGVEECKQQIRCHKYVLVAQRDSQNFRKTKRKLCILSALVKRNAKHTKNCECVCVWGGGQFTMPKTLFNEKSSKAKKRNKKRTTRKP